jgi:hypothetical protein
MKLGVPLFRGDDTAAVLAEKVEGSLSDADRVGIELGRRMFGEKKPTNDFERGELAALQAAHTRLTQCEERSRALFALKTARQVMPAVTGAMVEVLAADVAAVLATGEKLVKVAVSTSTRSRGRSPYSPEAVAMAQKKSGWVTSSKNTLARGPRGELLQHTLLAFSIGLGAQSEVIFYCEANERFREYDVDDADSLKRLAYAAMATLEARDKRRP